MIFEDRTEAGQQLASVLSAHSFERNAAVVALPDGAIVVAYEVAFGLSIPLDVVVVCPVFGPGSAGTPLGYAASGAVEVLEEGLRGEAQVAAAFGEVERIEQFARGVHAPVDLAGKTVILVDDGLTPREELDAEVESVRARAPMKLVVALPFASLETEERLRETADEVVRLGSPEHGLALEQNYRKLEPVTLADVRSLLRPEDTEVGEIQPTVRNFETHWE
jgi:predicted phosphoribosyltransferase